MESWVAAISVAEHLHFCHRCLSRPGSFAAQPCRLHPIGLSVLFGPLASLSSSQSLPFQFLPFFFPPSPSCPPPRRSRILSKSAFLSVLRPPSTLLLFSISPLSARPPAHFLVCPFPYFPRLLLRLTLTYLTCFSIHCYDATFFSATVKVITTTTTTTILFLRRHLHLHCFSNLST